MSEGHGPDPAPLTALTAQVLLALADRPRYGYAILKEIERQTAGELVPKTGSLYAALQRLQDDGLITEAPEAAGPDEDSRRRYYTLTELGYAVARGEAVRQARMLAVAREKRLVRVLPNLLSDEA